MANEVTGRTRKKFVALRLNDQTIKLLERLAKRTGKTKTRLMEEAIFLHASEV